jgi:hypothetical protein
VNVFCCTVTHFFCSAKAILVKPCSCGGSMAARASAGVDDEEEKRSLLAFETLSLLTSDAPGVPIFWTRAACSSFLSLRDLLPGVGDPPVLSLRSLVDDEDVYFVLEGEPVE